MTTVSPRAQLAPPYCLSPPTDELPPFLNDVPEQEEMFVKEESEQVINFFAVAEEGDGGSSPGVKDEPSSSPDDTDSTKAKSEKDEVEDEVKDDDTKANHNKYCHFCQHIKVKRASSMLACENRGCNRRFCEHCLTTHLHDARSSQEWRRMALSHLHKELLLHHARVHQSPSPLQGLPLQEEACPAGGGRQVGPRARWSHGVFPPATACLPAACARPAASSLHALPRVQLRDASPGDASPARAVPPCCGWAPLEMKGSGM